MELYFLGTGAGVPSKHRNVTSIALSLLQEQGVWWLFDCGEATQHQVLHSPMKLNKVDKIFITHLHGDHLFGLPGVLSSRSFQGGETEVTLYGPTGLKEFVTTALAVSQTHLTYPISIVEIEQPGLLFESEKFSVKAYWLEHGVPSLGYRIEEHMRPGPLLPERAKAYGILPGPLYRELKSGKSVTLEDGRIVTPGDVTGPSIPGRIVAILGDTKPCDGIQKVAQHADLLVHEATFALDKAELAPSYNHSTAEDAARAAKSAGVKRLVLTHISARYNENDLPILLAEAREVFEQTFLAFDHFSIEIPTEGHAPPSATEEK